MVADDLNGDTLAYTASGLPTGLAIDATLGSITGITTEGGVFDVTVTVTDGITPVDVVFQWTVDPGFVCTVTGDTLSWTHDGPTTYYIRHLIGTQNNYLGAVTGALDYTVPSQFGQYKVTAFTPSRIETFCDAPLGEPQAFTCTVTDNTLTWTNQGATTYYIRHLIGTQNNYLGAVTGALDYTVPSQFGQYKVTAFTPSRIETFCDAPLGEPQAFTCTVTDNTLTWTNQGATTYYIRHLIGTQNNYLGAVTGALDYTVPSQFGQYKVTAFTPSRIETFCDAPLGEPQAFTCTVTDNTLTWTNQGATTYYIRHLIGTQNNYLGAVTGALDYTVPSQFGQYKVTAFTPSRIETFCDAPLGEPPA